MGFWDKVDQRGSDECWPFIGCISNKGYGLVQWMGRSQPAHRVAWMLTYGEEPPLLDHTCHNGTDCAGGFICLHRRCCNPAHLRPATHRENLLSSPLTLAAKNAAKTHCPKGHPYDEENTYIDPKKRLRHCRECNRVRCLARYHRLKGR